MWDGMGLGTELAVARYVTLSLEADFALDPAAVRARLAGTRRAPSAPAGAHGSDAGRCAADGRSGAAQRPELGGERPRPDREPADAMSAWRAQAACADVAVAVFYPAVTPGLDQRRYAPDPYAGARLVCEVCPVVAQCPRRRDGGQRGRLLGRHDARGAPEAQHRGAPPCPPRARDRQRIPRRDTPGPAPLCAVSGGTPAGEVSRSMIAEAWAAVRRATSNDDRPRMSRTCDR